MYCAFFVDIVPLICYLFSMRDAANAALEIYGAKRSFVSFFSPTAVNKIGGKV